MTATMRVLDSRVVYENPWVSVTEDRIEYPDGSTGIYGVVHKPDYAVVIPIADGRVHLVEQYRHPIGRRCWELPQGAVRDGAARSPEQVAAIELAEETGLTAQSLRVLGYLHDAYGVLDNGFHVVLATDLTEGEPDREHTEQDMRSAWFDLAEAWAMVDDGRITDSSTVCALALLARHAGAAG